MFKRLKNLRKKKIYLSGKTMRLLFVETWDGKQIPVVPTSTDVRIKKEILSVYGSYMPEDVYNKQAEK